MVDEQLAREWQQDPRRRLVGEIVGKATGAYPHAFPAGFFLRRELLVGAAKQQIGRHQFTRLASGAIEFEQATLGVSCP